MKSTINLKSKLSFKAYNTKPLLRYFLLTLASYFIVKFLLRPLAVAYENSVFVEIIVFSYPNFCEALIGTIVVSILLLGAQEYLIKKQNLRTSLSHKKIYGLAVLLSGIYVILQECNIHNLGGYNTVCQYDLIFSILGLITVYFLLLRVKPIISLK